MFSKRSKESKDDSGGGERRRTSRQTADRKFRSSMPVNITSSSMSMSRTNGSRDNLRASVQNGGSRDNLRASVQNGSSTDNYRRQDSSSSGGERRNRRVTNDDAKFRASTMTYTRRSTFDSSSDSLDRTKDRRSRPAVDTKFSFNDSSERSGGRSSGRSSKSSPTKSPRHKQPSQSNNNKLAIKEYLSTLKLPPGIFSSVLQSYNITDSRLYLLDNSSLMKIRDSHLATNNTNGRRSSRTLDSTKQIECVDNVTRWDELSECILFHAKMASKCWIPTKYWLVNDETGQGKHKFSLCWGSTQDIPSEYQTIKQTLQEDVTLSLKQCPLAKKLHSIAKGINKQADNLEARDKRVTLIICSQGLPTDENGQTSSKLRKEFQYELAYLGKLPVKTIVRLTTDDERVMDMFNTMDSRFDCIDVLDDYWGEAMEVYLHNPWLTYGMGLHRLREAGLAPDVMDDLDETVLSLDEMYDLCKIMFVGDDEFANLPRPIEGDRLSWSKFMRSLRVLVEKEPLQWNPIKKKLMPWINLEKLDAMHGLEDRRCSMFNNQSMHQAMRQAAAQAKADDRRQRKSMPDIAEDPPEERREYRRQTTHSDPLESHPPSPRQRRRQCRRPSGLQPTTATKKATTLEEVIKQWSHKSDNDYKHFNPLDQLLVTVPNLFPPTNTMVEDHDYFAKWKTLDTDAFSDVSNDEKNELMKRAVRKAKFFLHPDKLPKDLTEKQSTLFKSIWDTLQEREAATLG